jgi:hypothetical protein
MEKDSSIPPGDESSIEPRFHDKPPMMYRHEGDLFPMDTHSNRPQLEARHAGGLAPRKAK